MSGLDRRKDPRQDAYATVGLGAAAAITVWAIYYPADATGVELGSALGITCMLMVWVLAMVGWLWIEPTIALRNASWWVDVSALGLAAWVLLAAWVTGGILSVSMPDLGGDLRAATNEAWWWIAAAGFFVLVRRLMFDVGRVRVIFGLLLGLGTLLAVHTLHQSFVSLPETMREYLRDPDAALSSIGIHAPAGSAARMIYENRLRDGGPTATFALANSLAGPLGMIATLSGGCLLCLLKSFRSRSDIAAFALQRGSLSHRVVLVITLCAVFSLIVVALLMTGSRSGVLSVVVVGLGWAVSVTWTRASRPLRVALASLIGLSVIAILLWWQASGDSWAGGFAAGARATIELRWQYWRSTLAMVLDHPWFGSGPGNFQLVYQKYRDVRAHEMIAEPHNFMIETLACGGAIAGVLLTIGTVAGCMVYRTTLRGPVRCDDETAGDSNALGESTECSTLAQRSVRSLSVVAVAVGAFVGLLTVWYHGISNGMLPDFEAHLYAVPAAMLTMAAWWSTSSAASPVMNGRECRRIASAAVMCGLIHLCFSGGWTIPGVSMVLIWLAGIATNVPNTRFASVTPIPVPSRTVVMSHLRRARLVAGLIGCVLLMVMVLFSLRPVERTRAAMALAATQLKTQRIAAAESTLRTVIQNDALATDAAIWLAEIANRKTIRSLASPTTAVSSQTQKTDDAFTVAISRAGNNPTLLRALGELLLHRYQVGGRIDDLDQAERLFAKAIELSPTHETMIAQQSEIVRELSVRGGTVEGESAAELARRAKRLASSGGVITRDLKLQLILPARRIGRTASENPVRVAAAELLRDQPDGPLPGNDAK